MLAVDERNITMPARWPPPEACSDGTVANPSQDIHCRPIPAFAKDKEDTESITIESIALFHYVIKSLEDFQIKIRRGGGDKFNRDETYFRKTDKYAPLTTFSALTDWRNMFTASEILANRSAVS
jgi:hypothetical protein